MRAAEAWVGLAVLVISAAAPTLLFWHQQRAYASGKEDRLPSQAQFRRVDHGMRFMAVVIGSAALFSSAPALLRWHHSPTWEYVGIVVIAAGLGLLVAAKRALGFNYSPCFDGYVPFAVVDRGPYRILRHPMYVAYLLIAAGVCVLTGTAWLVITWIIWLRWFRQAAVIEETELGRRFPDYNTYLHRTSRFLPTLRIQPLVMSAWPPTRNVAPPKAIRRAPAEEASSAPDAA